jgi:hypothetical protein
MKGLTFGVCWVFGPLFEGVVFLSGGVSGIIQDEDLRLVTSETSPGESRALTDDDETG